jgi:hypothetical protein
MTSASFAARFSRAVSHTSAQHQPLPLESHDESSTGTPSTHTRSHNHHNQNNNNNNPSDNNNNNNNVLHAHRQNHNSSKLPAFRFADLRKDRISLPSLQQPTPLAPVLSQTTVDQSAHIPGSSQSSLHHHSSFPERPVSLEKKQSGGATRTRSLKFHLPPTIAPSADSSPGPKRPASDDVSARSQLSSVVATAPLKRRLTESAANESAPHQRELQSPNAVEPAKPDDKKSRPPISRKHTHTTSTGGAASTSSGRAVIPPIRAFRSSGSRKSVVLDMHNRRTSEDSYSGEPGDTNQRDRALRALEGRRDDDFTQPPSESGEMTATTDNDNTADIFMKIAREDPAPRTEKPAAVAEPSHIVSSLLLLDGYRTEPLANIS